MLMAASFLNHLQSPLRAGLRSLILGAALLVVAGFLAASMLTKVEASS